MKKIEIIERITDANGSISENILTSWEHKNQFKLLSRDLFPKKLFPTKNKAGYLSILH